MIVDIKYPSGEQDTKFSIACICHDNENGEFILTSRSGKKCTLPERTEIIKVYGGKND